MNFLKNVKSEKNYSLCKNEIKQTCYLIQNKQQEDRETTYEEPAERKLQTERKHILVVNVLLI